MNRDKAITVKNISNTHLRRTIQKLEQQMSQALSTARFNGEVQQNIDGLEFDLAAPDTPEDLFHTVLSGVQSRFGIHSTSVCLSKHFFGELYPELGIDRVSRKRNGLDHIRTIHEEELQDLFREGAEPVLRGHLEHGSPDLFPVKQLKKVRSEAVIPLLCDKKVVGTVNLGDPSPERFLDGLGTTFLKRLSLTLSNHLEKMYWKLQVKKNRNGSESVSTEGPLPGLNQVPKWLEQLKSTLDECIRLAEEVDHQPIKDSLDQLQSLIGKVPTQSLTLSSIPAGTGSTSESQSNVIPLPLEKKGTE